MAGRRRRSDGSSTSNRRRSSPGGDGRLSAPGAAGGTSSDPACRGVRFSRVAPAPTRETATGSSLRGGDGVNVNLWPWKPVVVTSPRSRICRHPGTQKRTAAWGFSLIPRTHPFGFKMNREVCHALKKKIYRRVQATSCESGVSARCEQTPDS